MKLFRILNTLLLTILAIAGVIAETPPPKDIIAGVVSGENNAIYDLVSDPSTQHCRDFKFKPLLLELSANYRCLFWDRNKCPWTKAVLFVIGPASKGMKYEHFDTQVWYQCFPGFDNGTFINSTFSNSISGKTQAGEGDAHGRNSTGHAEDIRARYLRG